ncbi:nucleotidyltransferase family protein [Kaistia geumhonensis]|uniref:Nucleotidyltransferase family protein n=1 Tax=Kaistia geumhonensis TaxID=410839 RepID=A0ABU0M9X9_9HYPH|nr:nucleotidyltransferase family protein [Kaistia geumhonensis]MCX5480534.1 nucleotidyltransferase family protein [Kaistia geumhonensis]MDQ0517764.1 hypothetical protein [Kaistia geumhonensis]
MTDLYPESFPDPVEEAFLRLVLAPDSAFRERWECWKRATVFDDIPFAVLRTLPMLHLRLAALGIEDDELTGRIRGVYRQAWFRNQMLLDRTAKIAVAFNAADIPVMLLKGVAMMTDVFPSAGARMTDDADLMVHERDVLKAVDLMRVQGGRRRALALAETDDFAEAHLAFSHAVAFELPGGVALDLHWQPYHNSAIDHPVRLLMLRDPSPAPDIASGIWARARHGHLKGVPVLLQSLEDMLLHTIEHGARANAHRPFRWVLDASAIIATPGFDFDRFAAIAASTPFAIHARVACRYLSERMDIAVPPAAMAALDAVPVSKPEVQDYYRTGRMGRPSLFGKLPLIWYAYWKTHRGGSLAGRLKNFPGYLRRQWELPPEQGLLAFAVAKYRRRLPQCLRPAGPRRR